MRKKASNKRCPNHRPLWLRLILAGIFCICVTGLHEANGAESINVDKEVTPGHGHNVFIPPPTSPTDPADIKVTIKAAECWVLVSQETTTSEGWDGSGPYFHSYEGDPWAGYPQGVFKGKLERDPDCETIPVGGGGAEPEEDYTVTSKGSPTGYFIEPRQHTVCVGQDAIFTTYRWQDGEITEEPSNWTLDVTAYGTEIPAETFSPDPGTYTVHAQSSATPSLSDTATLIVLKIDIEQTNVYRCAMSTDAVTLNLTADSYWGEAPGTVHWEGGPDDEDLGSGPTVSFTAYTNWPAGEQYTITAYSSLRPECRDTATLTIIKVEFKEFDEVNDNYGWDDYTLTTSSIVDYPYKSVMVGGSDRVFADVTPDEAYTEVEYNSTSSAIVDVAPQLATPAEEIIVYGISSDFVAIRGKVGGIECDKFITYAYEKPETLRVGVRRIFSKPSANGVYAGYDCDFSLSEAVIEEKLKKVFRQAVVEFEVEILPTVVFYFDENQDYKIQTTNAVGEVSIANNEMQKIIEEYETTDHDFNIFLVSNPTQAYVEGSLVNLNGIMQNPGKFGFVFVPSATTFAHELGHGLGGLPHALEDEANIMSYGDYTRWRLRKYQWPDLNARAWLISESE